MAARCEARAHASSRRALLDNAPAMFKSFWEHRDLIPRAASSATGGDLAVYTGIGQVLQRFITLYERVGVVPVTPATFIPHVGLCCWFNLEETSAWAQTGLFAMRFLTDPRTYHAVEPSVMFVQAGADAYGPEPLVKRFLKDVKSRSIPWVHIRVSLGLLSRFIAHSPFEPLIARYKIFDLFAEVGSRSLCEAPSSEAWIIWLECSSFLRCELDFMHGGLETGVFEASSRFLPVGREIFAMLACGIQQLIWRQRSRFNCFLRIANSRTCRTLSGTLEDFMPFRNPIQALVKVIRRCKQKPGQHSDAFRRDLKKEANRVWYPALRMLRTEQQRTSTRLGRSLPDAVELWTDLGAQLGLKELRERDRYEREGLSHCAWKLCRYHIETPESVLSACRGCGEARYCGRRCQTRDWKEGGHKAKCRRLK
ncbi:hypothetical protein OF83DRAFT_760070 [Amylostereum chailletii]|nr:hypothetical protein OF83DRAFT_760070 [Amylostereum chailletii]